MTNPEPPDPKIAEKFRRIESRHIVLMFVAFGLNVVIFLVSIFRKEINEAVGVPDLAAIIAVSAVALFLVVVVLLFTNWRCPTCGRFLGRSPAFCRNCGTRLHG